MISIGISGTDKGGTPEQLITLEKLLSPQLIGDIHHGDCIGVDAQVHELVLRIRQVRSNGFWPPSLIIHPPDDPKKRAFCQGADFTWPGKPYLIRNQDIVRQCDLIIGVPSTPYEVLRSGTWATLRYAGRTGRMAMIVLPDGSIVPYEKGSHGRT